MAQRAMNARVINNIRVDFLFHLELGLFCRLIKRKKKNIQNPEIRTNPLEREPSARRFVADGRFEK